MRRERCDHSDGVRGLEVEGDMKKKTEMICCSVELELRKDGMKEAG